LRSREVAKAAKGVIPNAKVYDYGDQIEVCGTVRIEREDCEKGGCTVELSVLIMKWRVTLEFGIDGYTEDGLRRNVGKLPEKCLKCLMGELLYWKGEVLKSL